MAKIKLKYGICTLCHGLVIPLTNSLSKTIGRKEISEFVKELEIEKDDIIDPEFFFAMKNIGKEVHFGFINTKGKFVPLCCVDSWNDMWNDIENEDYTEEDAKFSLYLTDFLDSVLEKSKNKKGDEESSKDNSSQK